MKCVVVQLNGLLSTMKICELSLSPPGGLVSPSGGFVSLLCDQLGPSNSILHQFYCARLLVVTRFLSLDVTVYDV